MSQKQTNPDSGYQRLLSEGYEVELRHSYMLVYSVPYVNSAREVVLGVLVSEYGGSDKPKDHTVWFRGETPCTDQGQPLNHVVIDSTRQRLFDDFDVTHRFSNK